jgi:hypothetical protein
MFSSLLIGVSCWDSSFYDWVQVLAFAIYFLSWKSLMVFPLGTFVSSLLSEFMVQAGSHLQCFQAFPLSGHNDEFRRASD